MSILFFFIAISLAHALVPHDHPYDSFVSEFGLPVHNVAGEKYFVLLLLSSLLVVTPYCSVAIEFFAVSRLTGLLRTSRTTPPRIYAHIFARGILHSKAY